MKNIAKILFQAFLILGILNTAYAVQQCDPTANCPDPNLCADDSNTNCCTIVDVNCDPAFIQSNTLNQPGCDECTQCLNGYYLQSGQCLPCTGLFSDCTSCSGGICTACSTLLQSGACVNSCGDGFYDNNANECDSCSINNSPNPLTGSNCFTCADNLSCTQYCDDAYDLSPQGQKCLDCNALECTSIGCLDQNAAYDIGTGTCLCNQGYVDSSGTCVCDTAGGYFVNGANCDKCSDVYSGVNNIETCDTCNNLICLTGTCVASPVNSGLINGACTLCSTFEVAPVATCTQCTEAQCLQGTCQDQTTIFVDALGQCISCSGFFLGLGFSCSTCEDQSGTIVCLTATCAQPGDIFDSASQTCQTCDTLFGNNDANTQIASCSTCTEDKCTAGVCIDPINQVFDLALGICRQSCALDEYYDQANDNCVACSTITGRCTECDATPLCTKVECLNSQYETTTINIGKDCINCNSINDDCEKCTEDPINGPICTQVSCISGKYQFTDPVTSSLSCASCSDFDNGLETCNACTELGCTDRNCPTAGTFKNGGSCFPCNDVAYFGANCLTCDINTCLTNDCADGTYYDQVAKSCVSCSNDWSINCLTCDDTQCLTNDCPVGTFYSQDQKSCVSCSDVPNGGVDQCSECDDAQTTTTCTNCGVGYILDDTVPVPFCDSCSNRYSGLEGTCLTCDVNNCLSIQCSDGYYDNNLACELCTNTYTDDCNTCDSSSCLTFCPAGQVNALPCTNCWEYHLDNKALTCDLDKTESSCLPGFVPLSGACVQCSIALSDDTCAECDPVDYTTATCTSNCAPGQYAYLGQCLSCSDKHGDNCAACSFSTCTLTCNDFQNAVNGACVDKTCQEVYGIRCLICDFSIDLCTTTCSGGFYVDATTDPDTCVDCSITHGADCAACDDAVACSLDCSTLPGTHPVGGLCCNSDETEVNGECVSCSLIFGPDCLTCDNNECLSCSGSSFPLGGTCIPCLIYADPVNHPQEDCATCDELGCNLWCPVGQYAKDGACSPCTDFGNCALCSLDTGCQLPCEVYEYPENGGCQSCSTAIPGCATCTGSDALDCTLLCNAPEVPTLGICCQSNQYNDNGVCADCTAVHGAFCETCTGAATCDTCRFGKDPITGLCVEQCELNQFGTYPDCTDCSTINANCQTCTDANTCTLCQDADGNQQYINGLECVDSCPDATFDAGSFTCQNCATGCLQCNDATSCNDCGSGQYFNSATPACEACPASLGGSGECLECSIDGTVCTQCDDSFYFNGLAGSCDLCSNALPECQNCSNDGLTCTLCNEKFEWDGTQCALIPCAVADCSACEADINVCEACGNSKVLDIDTNTCVESCGDGRFDNKGICDDCIENCLICSNDISCQDCGNNFLKADATCTDNCGDYFYSDDQSTPKVCVSCADAHCLTCTSGNAGDCTACENGWFDDGNGGCTDVSPQPCQGQCEAWTNRIYKKGEKACHDDRCFTAKFETRLNFDEPDIYSWSAYWTVNYDITCATAAPFDKNKVYNTGQFVIYNGSCWKARWQNTAQWWDGNVPGKGNSWTKQ